MSFKKLNELVCSKCTSFCPSPDLYKCCDKFFCDKTERDLLVPIDKPGVGGLPYMGSNGCVVPPELRPFCTAFICDIHLQDRTFRRHYERITKKLNYPATRRMSERFKRVS